MNPNHWFPFDPKVWLTDTLVTDSVTETAHLRLTLWYYLLGQPITADEEKLMTMGKVKLQDWSRVKGELISLGWQPDTTCWRHKRCDKILAEMELSREKRKRQTAPARQAKKAPVTTPVTTVVTTPVTNSVTAVQSQSQVHIKRLIDERLSVPTTKDIAPPVRSSINRSQESELMDRLTAVLGQDEMARAGGHWRVNHVRKHPDRVDRGLAEIERMMKEHIPFTENKAACLEDLMKRWA